MKTKGVFFSGLILSAVVMSCSNAKEIQEAEINSANLGDTVNLKLNEIVICEQDINLFVQLDTVYEDSRCPIDATCIWEGNAEVGFSVTYNKELHPLKLNTNKDKGTTQSIEDYSFELVYLHPYPGSPNAESTPTSADIVIRKK